jgi:anti-anti-sigma regulatory factor
MAGNGAGACSAKLEGGWFMDQAVDLQKLLIGKLAEVSEEAAGSGRVEIDMVGLADLDACCCQLLAVFLENLKRRGIAPVCCGMSQQLQDKITLLGFSQAFSSAEPKQVSA